VCVCVCVCVYVFVRARAGVCVWLLRTKKSGRQPCEKKVAVLIRRYCGGWVTQKFRKGVSSEVDADPFAWDRHLG
jgi:hypothetical protein